MTMQRVGITHEYIGLSTDQKPPAPKATENLKPIFQKFWELDTGRTFWWRDDKGWVEVKIPTDTNVLSALQVISRQLEQVQTMLVQAHELDTEVVPAED